MRNLFFFIEMHRFTMTANLRVLLVSDNVLGLGGWVGGEERKTNMYKEAMFSTIDYTLNRNISDPVGSERYHFKSFYILIFFLNLL